MQEERELINIRRTSSLLGMPVYSLHDAKRIGSVRGLVYDPEAGRLLGLRVREPGFLAPEKWILPIESIDSFGNDAIMVDDASALVKEKDFPDAYRLVSHKITIEGNPILTKSGNKLGIVVDIFINEKTGRAASYEVAEGPLRELGGERKLLSAGKVIKTSKHAVIVLDSVEREMAESLPDKVPSVIESQQSEQMSVNVCTPEQEMDLCRGKIAQKDVYDDYGNLIVGKGEEITQNVLHQAMLEDELGEVMVAAGVECKVTEDP